MKLVDMTCTGCGANVTVDSAVKVATCTVCGKQMLISMLNRALNRLLKEQLNLQTNSF